MKDVVFTPQTTMGALLGVACLPRDIADLTIWKKRPFDAGHALGDLFLLANTTAGQHTLERGIVVDYVPGEILWSNKGLADRWGWHRDSVEKLMVELEKSEIISRRSVGQYGKVIKLVDFTVISAANRQPEGSEPAANRQPLGQPNGTVGGTESNGGTERGDQPPRPITLEHAFKLFAVDDDPYTENSIREQWFYYDAMRHPGTGFWQKPRGNTGAMIPVSDWRSELMAALLRFGVRESQALNPTTATKGNGEAAWKKLRALDDKIKEIEIQITGFENTAPELAERLEADLKKLRAERKAIADE